MSVLSYILVLFESVCLTKTYLCRFEIARSPFLPPVRYSVYVLRNKFSKILPKLEGKCTFYGECYKLHNFIDHNNVNLTPNLMFQCLILLFFFSWGTSFFRKLVYLYYLRPPFTPNESHQVMTHERHLTRGILSLIRSYQMRHHYSSFLQLIEWIH